MLARLPRLTGRSPVPPVALAAVFAALLLTCASEWGCDAPASQGSTQVVPPAPMQHPMLEGVPLPAGFRIVPERSVGRSVGAIRVGQYEFEGSVMPVDVARFYREHMPAARFAKQDERFDNGEYSLRFESDREVCNIRARPARARAGRTTLAIDIGPLPKGSTERVSRPIAPPP